MTRYISYWLAKVFTLLLPILFMTAQYGKLIEEKRGLGFTLTGIVAIIMILFAFKKDLGKWISTWQWSLGKGVAQFILGAIPIGIVTLIIWYARVEAIAFTEMWFNITASYLIGIALAQYHEYKVYLATKG